jgi:hypothetical protein
MEDGFGLFEPGPEGTYALQLDEEDRRLLSMLSRHLAEKLEADPQAPVLERLFPTAYPKDPEREQEWRLLMSMDLHERRREQLALLDAAAGGAAFTADELHVWMQALNDLRLYLGTRLDISEETELEDFDDEGLQQLFVLYDWLSGLLYATVDVLTETL